jgi:Na+-transporting NADH:ubiquinone oxidoreductase subunit NqrF
MEAIHNNWYGQCNRCKAIIKVDSSELLPTTEGVYSKPSAQYFHHDCPFCTVKQTVTLYNESTATGKHIKDMAFFDQE